MQEIANELHKPVKKIKTFRKVFSNYINEIFAIDLIELLEFEKENQGYKYIIFCIDVYSRYAFYEPMKNKSGPETSKALENIFKKASNPPKKIWTDEGKEFYNKNVDSLRKKYNDIIIYSTYGNAKASIVERFNRTIKNMMYKQFTINGNHKWINIINDLVNKYNNKKHSSIENKTPKLVYDNKITIISNSNDNRKQDDKPLYNVSDKVRVSYKRMVFDKGYLPKWSYEIFTVNEIINSTPITYKIKDENNEIIKGCFYADE